MDLDDVPLFQSKRKNAVAPTKSEIKQSSKPKVLSQRAAKRLARGLPAVETEWWKEDRSLPPELRQALLRNIWPEETAGNWKAWVATEPIESKWLKRISFFPYPELFPSLRGVFATSSLAEIRIYKVSDKGVEHLSTILDATANNLNPIPPKRPEREAFNALNWSFTCQARTSASRVQPRGVPLLLAAGDVGVVKVYNPLTLEHVQTLVGHGGPIMDIAVCPQLPSLIATASHDRAVRLWNLMVPDYSCVGLLAGNGGHRKEVLSLCFHPTLKLLISGAVDRYMKVWALPDSFFTNSPSTNRVTQIHDPIFSTRLVHSDHVDQIEFLDECTILSKSRAGRDRQTSNLEEVCEIAIWRCDLLREVVLNECGAGEKVLAGLGWDGFEDSYSGSFELLQKVIVPKQGFYGRSMVVSDGKCILGLEGAVWECEVDKMPFDFGLDRPTIEKREGWEKLARAPTRGTGKLLSITSAALSPDEKWLAACGEEGIVVVFRRIAGLEEEEDLEVKREMIEKKENKRPPVSRMEILEISDED